MSAALQIVFDVLVAASFSFVGAALLTTAGARLLRIRDGRLKLALVFLPFAKAVFEIARGIPKNAFFWLRLHEGATQELGGFRIGFGMDRVSPIVHLSLSARWHGAEHPQSAADLLATVLSRRLGGNAPSIFAAIAIGVACIGVILFAARLARMPRPRGEILETRALDRFRHATILVCPAWDGAPFARGVLRPVVCLPARLTSLLTDEEREAVIQHELAHLRGLHLVVVVATGVLERLLWFVPGTGLLAREARAQCEVLADDGAARAGVDRTLLASTLVRVAELATPRRLSPPLAFFDRAPVLRRRVAKLLAPARAPRLVFTIVRGAAFALLAATVLRATMLGHP